MDRFSFENCGKLSVFILRFAQSYTCMHICLVCVCCLSCNDSENQNNTFQTKVDMQFRNELFEVKNITKRIQNAKNFHYSFLSFLSIVFLLLFIFSFFSCSVCGWMRIATIETSKKWTKRIRKSFTHIYVWELYLVWHIKIVKSEVVFSYFYIAFQFVLWAQYV